MTDEKILTTAGAARRLDLTPAGVRAMTARGDLEPEVVTESGQRLYSLKSVDAVRARRQEQRSKDAA